MVDTQALMNPTQSPVGAQRAGSLQRGKWNTEITCPIDMLNINKLLLRAAPQDAQKRLAVARQFPLADAAHGRQLFKRCRPS